jgi:hypothetical protein
MCTKILLSLQAAGLLAGGEEKATVKLLDAPVVMADQPVTSPPLPRTVPSV